LISFISCSPVSQVILCVPKFFFPPPPTISSISSQTSFFVGFFHVAENSSPSGRVISNKAVSFFFLIYSHQPSGPETRQDLPIQLFNSLQPIVTLPAAPVNSVISAISLFFVFADGLTHSSGASQIACSSSPHFFSSFD